MDAIDVDDTHIDREKTMVVPAQDPFMRNTLSLEPLQSPRMVTSTNFTIPEESSEGTS